MSSLGADCLSNRAPFSTGVGILFFATVSRLSPGTHYPKCTEDYFTVCRAAGAWRWTRNFIQSWGLKCSQLYLRCPLQPFDEDKFNAFSFERGTHFPNCTLFLDLLPFFFSITFFRPVLYFQLPFSFSFLFFYYFLPLYFTSFWLPYIPFLVSPIFFLSCLSLLKFSVHFLCSFFLLPHSVFTSLSTHHIASQTKCAWLLRSPLLPSGHVLDSAIWVALPASKCLYLFQQLESFLCPNKSLKKLSL